MSVHTQNNPAYQEDQAFDDQENQTSQSPPTDPEILDASNRTQAPACHSLRKNYRVNRALSAYELAGLDVDPETSTINVPLPTYAVEEVWSVCGLQSDGLAMVGVEVWLMCQHPEAFSEPLLEPKNYYAYRGLSTRLVYIAEHDL